MGHRTLQMLKIYVFKERLSRLIGEELIDLKMHENGECINKELSKRVLSVLPHIAAFGHYQRQAILPEELLV